MVLHEALRNRWLSPLDREAKLEIIAALRQHGHPNRLKQLVIDQKLNMECVEAQTARVHFEFLDSDNGGFVERRDLQRLLIELGWPSEPAKQHALQMIISASSSACGIATCSLMKRTQSAYSWMAVDTGMTWWTRDKFSRCLEGTSATSAINTLSTVIKQLFIVVDRLIEHIWSGSYPFQEYVPTSAQQQGFE